MMDTDADLWFGGCLRTAHLLEVSEPFCDHLVEQVALGALNIAEFKPHSMSEVMRCRSMARK